MKVLALGRLANIYDRALRYAFGLPLTAIIVGMETMDQLKKNLAVAESYQPLTDAERLDLFKEVLPMVSPDTLPWKAENWNRPAEWNRR
jgi:aryl-alcohol dehydrogenase-like predicted oxidoreductase